MNLNFNNFKRDTRYTFCNLATKQQEDVYQGLEYIRQDD